MVRYSIETRRAVLGAIQEGDSVRDVALAFDVSESFVRRLVRRNSETGSIAPLPRTNAGRKPKLNQEHLEVLRDSVVAEPCRTLREHRAVVGVECSLSVIHAAIKKLGLHDLRTEALDSGQLDSVAENHHEANGASNGHANGHAKGGRIVSLDALEPTEQVTR